MTAQTNEPPLAARLRMVSCRHCTMVCEDALDANPRAPCPRCGSVLRRRKPDSLIRSWAFLLASMVMYLPANLLPVMHTAMLAQSADSTIIGGIIEFWKAGSYGIALLIFTASIAVPCGKFLTLAYLLVSTQRQAHAAMLERARLYRLLELVGYWSMLDVLVVGWGSALAGFGALSDAEPRIGILFFGLVVVLTMLSSLSFDPRLIWDSRNNERFFSATP